ncbi:MAG: hypothetical protein U1F54_01235 [Burkholderiales bacterium]
MKFVDTEALLRSVGLAGTLPAPALRAVERMAGIGALSRLCEGVGITQSDRDVAAQIRRLFDAAEIRYVVRRASGSDGDDARPRATGPLVFYCNHPFGIADALIALELALSYRDDVKVLANNVLAALDINRDRLIFIDPFDGESRSEANRRGLRDALRHLRNGGALLMFPAGACSHLTLHGGIGDPPWTPHLPRFVASCAAGVVPIYFAGHNSWTFQLAGLAHPMLRTALLLREFVNLRGRTLQVVEGGVRVPDRDCDMRRALFALARHADA